MYRTLLSKFSFLNFSISALNTRKQHLSFILFLTVISIIALWFSCRAFLGIYRYFVLNSETLSSQVEWSVKELSDEKYVLHGKYVYLVNGESYTSETTLSHFPYRNHGAAERVIPEYAAKQWSIWYSPHNPAFSTLEKKFPIKECVSSVLLWSIMIYFICLKNYVAKRLS